MRPRLIWLLLVVSLLVHGGSIASAACFEGQRNDKPFLDLLDQAIDQVNGMLPDIETPLARLNQQDAVKGNQQVVPVTSVRSSRTSGMVAQVPAGCREIIVGGNEFHNAYQTAFPNDSLLTGDEIHMLSLLLLHELGHVKAGHHGAFVPIGNGAPILNIDVNTSKEYEREADAFVSSVLRQHAVLAQTGEADFNALWIIIFLSKLSFDISARASIDCFGCRPLGSTDIFWDHSQSHENLEYRLLQINHTIAATETSLELLSDFERNRQTQ